MTTARSEADRASTQLIGTDRSLTPLSKTAGVPTTDQPQKGKDFTSDQEVRWCPGCGDYVILNTIRNFLPTHYGDAWLGLLSTPLQTDDIVKGCISSLAYATIFFSLAWWRFLRKDVVS